jgi:cell division protein FtsN
MSKNGNSRTAAPSGKGGSLLAAVLVGMVLGLALAGGVAWYILQRPNPFVNTPPHDPVKLAPDPVKPVTPPVVKPVAPEADSASAAASGVASGVGETKPRFEFYKVLTDKPDGSTSSKVGAKPAEKSATKDKEVFMLQAAAFNNADDADNLKAKLAMLGLEANVQTATHNDKQVFRVRLGPFKSAEEMSKASAVLKQNGLSAISMRAQ